MVGLMLGMAASLALAGNGVKELRNIRKDVKKAEAKNAEWESLIKPVDEVNDILKETTETINEIDSDFEDLEKVEAECEKTAKTKTEKTAKTKAEKTATVNIESNENNSDGKYPAKKKKAAAKKNAAKKDTETK